MNGKKLRILDLACGTGFGSEVLSEVGDVVGVDISQDSLDYANSNYRNERTTYILGNADDVSFLQSLGKFDAIISLETVEHLADHYEYLRWARQALNPEGVLILSFPSTFTMDWAVPHHKRDITRTQARRLFSDCGFDIKNRFNQADRLGMHVLSCSDAHHTKLIGPFYCELAATPGDEKELAEVIRSGKDVTPVCIEHVVM